MSLERDIAVGANSNSQMNDSHPHGLPSPEDETHPAGFTAVNGDNRPSSVPAASSTTATSSAPAMKGNGEPEAISQWRQVRDGPSSDAQARPVESIEDLPPDATIGNKRKRADSRERISSRSMHLDTTNADSSGRESPKRRHLQAIQDSAIDLTSPNDATNGIQLDLPSERNSATPYEREPSPVPRRNQTQPPPRPRPETEASLAESVWKFQQNQQAEENRQSQPASTEVDGSPEDDRDDQEGHDQGDGPIQGDNYDPKKRKRIFSNRTKTGCHTCRERKKKCDERKPTCNNCQRGGFLCRGYGHKIPGSKHSGQMRSVIPLQQKPYSEQQPALSGYWANFPGLPHSSSDPRQYSNWPNPTPESESHRYPYQTPPPPPPPPSLSAPTGHSGRDVYGRSQYPYSEPPPTGHPPPPFPPDRSAPQSFYPTMPPPPTGHTPDLRRLPDPVHPPPLDNWYPTYPPSMSPSRPPGPGSSRASVGSAGSRPPSQYPLAFSSIYNTERDNRNAEKENMLSGKSYKHYTDETLLQERVECQKLLTDYNRTNADSDADESKKGPPVNRAWRMRHIMRPYSRPDRALEKREPHYGPLGSVGDLTVIEAPFDCDFGYHLHIGARTIIGKGCQFQDAGGIYIGDRVTVGPGVLITTMSPDPDPQATGGCQGTYRAGMVKIRDDVFIGGRAIIMPYVTIGKGAKVGAGAVVTQDVKEGWTVAGNPAKRIPSNDNDEMKPHKKNVIKEMEDMKMKEKWEESTKGKKRDSHMMTDGIPGLPPLK